MRAGTSAKATGYNEQRGAFTFSLLTYFREHLQTVQNSARALCVRLVALFAMLLLLRQCLPQWLLKISSLALACV